ncbi:MAG TPA: response regulator [Terriglobales bacterium]|nr:response regulator [Terriglobales bacterium]
MSSRPPINILLVDDQPSRLLSYETVLQGLGENLIRANSGNEALDLLLKTEIAVVLVDVVMPELDGFELARMIRNHPRFQKTAIILVSGVMVEDAYRLKGYDSGAVDYISVPIIPEILRAKVAVFCDLYRKTGELERLNQELEQRVSERTAEINGARQEAERANRLKDEFLATLSHELRTPLNAISGWAHLLLSGGLDAADQLKAAETIQRNALAQARLVADLLDVSRIISGKLEFDLQPVPLTPTVQNAVDSIRPAAAAKQIELKLALPAHSDDDRGFTIEGDPARLQQITANLLSNALKFAPLGGRVEVGLQPDTRDGRIELIVCDNGPGIAPDFLPYIFERFRQADTSSTRSQRGLGLGLTIVRHLVERHGGEITASNRAPAPGTPTGACFTVSFPLAASQAPPPHGETTPMPSVEGLRVLVVDDDPDARDLVARILGQHGAIVRLAASAAEALALFKREIPQVVVSDIEMPEQDGYALVRQIRALRRGARVPVAALTAYAGAQDRLRLLHAGFQEHIPKPVHPPHLIRVVAGLALTKAQPVAQG